MVTQRHVDLPRAAFVPIQNAAQGLGGGMNNGIIVVRNRHDRTLAIEKRLSAELIAHGACQREVDAMAQCDGHPNIVYLISYDFAAASVRQVGYGSVWMQYCELGSLDALMLRYDQRREMLADEGFVWKVFWDMALAVCYLATGHPNQATRDLAMDGRSATSVRTWVPMIHCDLKPSNVFLTWNDPLGADARSGYPTAVIGDFGVAAINGRPSAGGDRSFASPEVWSRRCSDKTNVWGVGIIIHCLVMISQSPYGSSAERERRPFGRLDVSVGLDILTRRCLSQYPAKGPGAHELPRIVWDCYKHWRRERRGERGTPLPEWAIPSQR